MKTLKGRILGSYIAFALLLTVLSALSFQYLDRIDQIRDTHQTILGVNAMMVNLSKEDLSLRTELSMLPDFYQEEEYPKLLQRNKLLDRLLSDLGAIEREARGRLPEIGNQVSKITRELSLYDAFQTRLMDLQRQRGFRDEGLEGEMRTFAHALERYPELAYSDLLTLRRHEKDYFMRDDLMYVEKFNSAVTTYKNRLHKDGVAYQLLVDYAGRFNEIVHIEQDMGTLQSGLKHDLKRAEVQVLDGLSSLANSYDARSASLIQQVINQFIQLALIGLIIAGVVGYGSAYLSSRSIIQLANSMHESIRIGYGQVDYRPGDWSTRETRSLYASYTELVTTIQEQLKELEQKNEQLSDSNTELIAVNSQLRISENQLRTSNSVKDKFFSIIGHDLKSPMATMTMLLQHLSEDIDHLSREDTVNFSKDILNSANSISMLLENLLQWSKSQTEKLIPEKTPLDLAHSVKECSRLVHTMLMAKDLRMDVRFVGSVVAYADKNMIDLIIRNLLINAIKFSHPGGKILIEGRTLDDEIVFSISDRGIGISPDRQQMIFDTLLKEQVQGTLGEKGTGLWTCYCT